PTSCSLRPEYTVSGALGAGASEPSAGASVVGFLSDDHRHTKTNTSAARPARAAIRTFFDMLLPFEGATPADGSRRDAARCTRAASFNKRCAQPPAGPAVNGAECGR